MKFAGGAGYESDGPLGWQLLGARYYDAGLGRFLSPDPISFAGGLNVYAYCFGDPVGLIDPSGLLPWYDDLSAAGDYGGEQQKRAVLSYWTDKPGGVAVATITNSTLDIIGGIVHYPSQIMHLGEGIGCFAGNPSLENLEGVAQDLITIGSVGIEVGEGLAALKSLGGSGPYVYRGLAEGEDPAIGLSARAPGKSADPVSHVAGLRESPWISTTKDPAIAMGRYGRHGVVRIDLSNVSAEVVDVSEGIPGKGRIGNWAKWNREVLIRDRVPAKAMTRIK